MIVLAAIAIVLLALPQVLRKIWKDRERRRLADQFRQFLQNLVHALRIGMGFLPAMEYAAQEGQEPLVAHWRWFIHCLRVGKSLDETLQELPARVPLKEIEWFASAVQITQSTGGSVADVLETLSVTLQERHLLREKVAALTAQGKVSGILLAVLPFAAMAALQIVAPDMIAPLFHTVPGQCLVGGMILSIATGGFVIKKIVTIRVD